MKFNEKFSIWLECVRGYSIPLTVMSWAVIFTYTLMQGGNFWLGLLAGFGIECAHLATNLIDDYFDYQIICADKNFANTAQKGKCRLICQNIITIKQLKNAIFILCGLAVLSGIILFFLSGWQVIWLMAIGAIAVLFYQKFSLIGMSELAVGIVYGPLMFEGVYYVMTGHFSLNAFVLSITSVMFPLQFLYTHTLLDFDGDMISHKKTLVCRIGDKNKALVPLAIFFFTGFLALIPMAKLSNNPLYLLGFLIIPHTIWLFSELKTFNKDKTIIPNKNILNFPLPNWEKIEKTGTQSFFFRLLLSRNIMVYMSLILIIAILFG